MENKDVYTGLYCIICDIEYEMGKPENKELEQFISLLKQKLDEESEKWKK